MNLLSYIKIINYNTNFTDICNIIKKVFLLKIWEISDIKKKKSEYVIATWHVFDYVVGSLKNPVLPLFSHKLSNAVHVKNLKFFFVKDLNSAESSVVSMKSKRNGLIYFIVFKNRGEREKKIVVNSNIIILSNYQFFNTNYFVKHKIFINFFSSQFPK